MKSLLGAVEAGGTKMVCAVAYTPGEVIDEVRFPTTTPEETLARVCEYFESAQKKWGTLTAIGYGTFGPAGILRGAIDYGKILATPKPGWEGADVVGFLKLAFPEVSVVFDTDVNAAAIGEGRFGAGIGMKHFIYVTVGTGIGGGVVVDGHPLHAHPHAEIGHMLIPQIDHFQGVCPFHQNCLEGMASGTAIGARWGCPAPELPTDHEAWELEAGYLAMMVQNLVATHAPERIILGGGVMEQPGLLEKVNQKFQILAGGYWQVGDAFLVRPQLGNQAGITGALCMAEGLRR